MRVVLVLAFVLASATVSAARDIAVVVSKTNSTKTLFLTDLAKMVKTSQKWSDGKAAIFVVKDLSLVEMKLVVQKVFGMTPEDARAFVAANKQSFLIVESDSAVVKTVAAMPSAIGLVDVYSITGAVNVVKIDGKTPLEPGYVLHGQ
jgi:hypothetical protein